MTIRELGVVQGRTILSLGFAVLFFLFPLDIIIMCFNNPAKNNKKNIFAVYKYFVYLQINNMCLEINKYIYIIIRT